jgi:hypothetical protein
LNDPTLAYVFDLDGVWLNNSHRLHHLEAKDYDTYYNPAVMLGDGLMWGGINLAHELSRNGKIIVVTGRPERTRVFTEAQVLITGVSVDQLVMRSDDDRRENHVYKTSVANTLRLPYWDLRLWVDDNPKVAAAMDELGIPTLLTAGVGQVFTKGV